MEGDNQIVQKERPTGIKLVAYFHYLLIAISVIAGVIALITGSSALGSALGSLAGEAQGLLDTVGTITVLLNILITSLICFFVGRGIWKGDKSAKIIVLIISCIVFIGQLFTLINYVPFLGNGYSIGSLLMSIFYLIAALVIFIYLISNKEAKEWFKK